MEEHRVATLFSRLSVADISGVEEGDQARNNPFGIRVLFLLLCRPGNATAEHPFYGNGIANSPLKTLSVMRSILLAAGFEDPLPERRLFLADTWPDIIWKNDWVPPNDSKKAIDRVEELIASLKISVIVFHGKENRDLFFDRSFECGASPFRSLTIRGNSVLALFCAHPRMESFVNSPIKDPSRSLFRAYRLVFLLLESRLDEFLYARACRIHVFESDIPLQYRQKKVESQVFGVVPKKLYVTEAPIIAHYCQKGGVGKTSSVFSVAWELAANGKKVLIVDADPQCSMTNRAMQQNDVLNEGQSLAKVWRSYLDFILRGGNNELPLQPLVQLSKLKKGGDVFLLRGDLEMIVLERELGSWVEKFQDKPKMAVEVMGSFRALMTKIAHKFGIDVVLIDCSPSIGVLNEVICSSSDGITLVFSPDQWCVNSMKHFCNIYEKVWFPDIQKWIAAGNGSNGIEFHSKQPYLLCCLSINTFGANLDKAHEGPQAEIFGYAKLFIEHRFLMQFMDSLKLLCLDKMSSQQVQWDVCSPYPASLVASAGEKPENFSVTRGGISFSKSTKSKVEFVCYLELAKIYLSLINNMQT